MMGFDRAEAQAALETWFAPWVAELGLQVERCEPGRVAARMPFSERFVRSIGGLSGQTIMAAIDTVMVVAVQTVLDTPTLVTTVSQTTNFLRAIGNVDVIYDLEVVKAGRTLAFANATAYPAEDPERISATATIT
jgi:uncharacterized protein (TIGR00369 family)